MVTVEPSPKVHTVEAIVLGVGGFITELFVIVSGDLSHAVPMDIDGVMVGKTVRFIGFELVQLVLALVYVKVRV